MKRVYASSSVPVPVYNIPIFKTIYHNMKAHLDHQGLLKKVELIALPHAVFQVLEESAGDILKVQPPGYPCVGYIDKRLVQLYTTPPASYIKQMPSKQELLLALHTLSKQKIAYIWGGNWYRGLPHLLELYPPPYPLCNELQLLWRLQGLDCTGLLYEISQGLTPRNSSQLLSYGSAVEIQDKNSAEIFRCLEPLDLIVWPGHLVIVLTPEITIEARFPYGVVTTPLEARLQEILTTRQPLNEWRAEALSHFVIRRWPLEQPLKGLHPRLK